MTTPMLGRASEVVEQAVLAGHVPGAALGVVRAGEAAQTACWGLAAREPEAAPLHADCTFDLASLTKVLFTVPELLRLVQGGLADLDDPLSRHLPEVGWMNEGGLGTRTLRQLLTHTAALPAHAPIYTWGGDASTLKQRILQEPWRLAEAGPGQTGLGESVYSDIGYMLLGMVVERLCGTPLATLPLSDGLTFTPLAAQSVATERCPWRGRVMRGEVHDENAHALGGVAGHAGLFGTLVGVLEAARGLLEGTALSPVALAEMRLPHTPTRALGWERRHHGWSGGSLCSPQTLGHTGFTGTGVWIDFGRGYAWALLTNNVHPSRHTSSNLGPLRRAVGNVLAAEWTTG